VGETVSYSPAAQEVNVVHTLSAEALLTTDAYSEAVHIVVSAQCLSEVMVGATLSN
jgi:hypothetical protein